MERAASRVVFRLPAGSASAPAQSLPAAARRHVQEQIRRRGIRIDIGEEQLLFVVVDVLDSGV